MKQMTGLIQERPVIVVWLPTLMIIVRTLISSIHVPLQQNQTQHFRTGFCPTNNNFLPSQATFQDSYEVDTFFVKLSFLNLYLALMEEKKVKGEK